ncbi:MAG TPA: DegQ family serine endoprotease [Gammaproteobacteria bacterium]|nr:DegQ family serine endoprotease [Gammaproteobacteria bacterium]
MNIRQNALHPAVLALTALLSLDPAGMPAAAAGLPPTAGTAPMPSLAPMIEQVTPAVVNIATEGHIQIEQNPLFNDPFFRHFFNVPSRPLQRRTQALGSGVIIDAQRGLVVTNNHVIANADEIRVKLRDGRVLEAKMVGTDPETDVAVIKIPPKDLTALPIADSDKLRVGDFVVAIGNPFGLGQTVTSGIISALARSGLGIGEYEDYIQTDASINPGNSGGALVNLRGELVGINTAIFSQSGGNIGIGFAIPANIVRQVVEQLVQYGQVKRGALGVQMQDLNADLSQAFGIGDTKGAVVVAVEPGSPAEKAGLQPGDVVTAVNGKHVNSATDARNQFGLLPAGEKIKLDILRNGKSQQVSAELTERTDQGEGVRDERLAGVTVTDIDSDSPLYGSVEGVLIVDVERNSRAWRNGLRAGDVITSVNRRAVANVKELLSAVGPGKKQLLLGVRRGNSAAFIVLK